LVHIIFTLPDLMGVEEGAYIRLLADSAPTFREQHQLAAGDIVLLDRFPDDLLTSTVAVDVCRIPGIEAAVISRLDDGEGLGSFNQSHYHII
jgi:hypothetical protein